MKYPYLLILIIIAFISNCNELLIGDSIVEDHEKITTKYGCVFYPKDSWVDNEDTRYNIKNGFDKAYEKTRSILEIEYTAKIIGIVYDDRDIRYVPNAAGLASYYINTIELTSETSEYDIYFENLMVHEMIHVMSTNCFGYTKLSFLLEGLAEGLSQSNIHSFINLENYQIYYDYTPPIEYDFDNDMPDYSNFLKMLITFSVGEFYAAENAWLNYRIAGSFCNYLWYNYGKSKFVKYYLNADNDNFEDLFLEIYDKKIDEIYKNWYLWIEQFQDRNDYY